MARSSLHLVLDQKTPLNLENKSGRALFRKIIRHLEGAMGGSVKASHMSVWVDGAQPKAAQAVITPTSVSAADTITMGIQTLTAAQHKASGTITFGTSVDNNDTITVNGVVFTAKDSGPVTANREFQNHATAATVAANFETVFNATSHASLDGIVSIKRASGVVTVFAATGGTAGNSITLASSDGVDLAVSGATLANGAAVANNEFDMAGTDTTTATAIAYAINNSTTAGVLYNYEASNLTSVITLSSYAVGSGVSINGHQFLGVTAATSPAPDGEFVKGATDTTAATALTSAINAHPVLCHQVYATSSGASVTVRQRRGTSALGKVNPIALDGIALTGVSCTQFAAAGSVLISLKHESAAGNQVTVATSNGTRLPILGSETAFAAGAGQAVSPVRIVMGSTI